jgi:glycosyltransferase involved in cell wall biosynthesis
MMPGICSAVKRMSPDVVHANDATSSFVNSVLLNARRTVVTVHGIGYSPVDWPTPFRQGIRTLQSESVKRAAAVVATDANTARELANIRSDVRTIPPGVDTDLFKKGLHARPEMLSENVTNVLYVGRLTRVKGIDLLIDAIGGMDSALRSTIRLTVIGEGPLADRVLSEALRGAPVKLLGPVPHKDLPPYFTNADLLVLPSRSEGLPISLLEAMSSTLPVVCSPVGGIRTYFDESLFTPINELSPEGVASAIGKTVGNMKEARDKALRGRLKVENDFSWDAIASRYDEVYKEVLR